MQDSARYSIRGEIASGATATVFLAEDRLLRRKVALKRLHPHLLGNAETVKRFRQEALAIAALSHENIIQVYDYGDQIRDLYLAMEYVDGASLESLLAGPTRILPNLAALASLHQLMSGLAAAHGAGIVHRDIKPSNVLVDSKGVVRIADFGLAFLAEEHSITKTGSYLGTPVYSSPEQANGLPALDKSDIFSAGILFYRCFTGHLPFQGENSHAILRSIAEAKPRKPSSLNRRLFPGQSELTMAMLARDPEKRPSAAACAEELSALASRAGFALEPARVRRLMAAPDTYPAAECGEIAARFLQEAGIAQSAGERRKAMKLRAQADLFSVPATRIEPFEAGRFERLAARASMRRVAVAAVPLAALVLSVGSWISMRHGPPPSFGAPATASTPAIPTAPATAPIPEAMPDSSAPDSPAIPAVSHAESGAEPLSVPAVRPSPAGTPRRPAFPKGTLPPERPSTPALPAPAPAPVAESVTDTLLSPARPADGGLMVKSNPPFATVRVDGVDAGRTPFKTPYMLAPGEHQIVVEREDYRTHKTTVKVESGAVLSLRLALDTLEPSAVAGNGKP